MLSQLPSLPVDQQYRQSSTPSGVTTTSFTHQAQGRGVRRALLQACQTLSQRSKLSIEKKSNFRGETWWQVTDPRSGKIFYAQTLNEAIHWIEVQRLG